MAVRRDASTENDPQMTQMNTVLYLRSICVILG
jgi:hypothetical protein